MYKTSLRTETFVVTSGFNTYIFNTQGGCLTFTNHELLISSHYFSVSQQLSRVKVTHTVRTQRKRKISVSKETISQKIVLFLWHFDIKEIYLIFQ